LWNAPKNTFFALKKVLMEVNQIGFLEIYLFFITTRYTDVALIESFDV